MDKELFHSRLIEVRNIAIKFAGSLISNELDERMPYYLLTNQSDDRKMNSEEVRYPELDLKGNEALGPYESSDQVVDILYRAGGVPEWIDACVSAIGTGIQYLELRCCGRFTRNDLLLYYKDRGSPPFSVKSPTLPKGGVQGERYSLSAVDLTLRKL